MAAHKTTKANQAKESKNKPLRIGKVRDGHTGRGWQAKLYGPTDNYSGSRATFKPRSTDRALGESAVVRVVRSA